MNRPGRAISRRPPVFFGRYARLYDEAYAGKDYRREALQVHRAIQAYLPGAKTLAELGCGTGGHARFFARWYRVVGFEQSEPMLTIAREKLRGLPVRLVHADIVKRSDYGRPECVVSLFHVLNYLDRSKLERVIRNVASSLPIGGVFVFDSWNAAALLRDPPRPRTRSFVSGGIRMTRTSTPKVHWLSSDCDVHITVRRASGGGAPSSVVELHRMHYFLPAELAHLLTARGFQVRRVTNDLGGPLSPDDWSMRFVVTRGRAR